MSDPLIEMRGVTFGYNPEAPVLSDLSWALRPGERVALTGSNGTGKTTLLRLIVGLVTTGRGEVEVLGQVRRHEADFVAVRRKVGLLFQDSDSQLFSPTVFEDVAFGPLNLGKTEAETRTIVVDTLASLQLSHLKDKVTYQLSHGQKRMVALATILAMKPRILLLDEPTAGLDRASESRLTEILMEREEEMLIVSHNPAFIEAVATRVLHLEEGRIEEEESISRV